MNSKFSSCIMSSKALSINDGTALSYAVVEQEVIDYVEFNHKSSRVVV